jgi:Insertion element 4 transposase N-terminal/Transposase DDE domain
LSAYLATGAAGEVTFPLPLIEEAVAATGVAGRRRRLLPGVAVVVFVLGCCLFSGEGYGEVARKLAGWLGPLAGPGGRAVPGSGALARARRRAGPAPLKLLFARVAGPLTDPAAPGAAAFGRLLVALDGTTLDVPHTPANVAAFGPPRGARSRGFPQVRLVTVAACGTRGLLDAAFRGLGAPAASEQDLARKIAGRGRLRAGMLVLADRNFCGYPAAAVLAATGADFLIRAKAGQHFPVLEALPDGSYRSVLPRPATARAWRHRNGERRRRGSPLPPDPRSSLTGIAVRVIEADITITPAGSQPRTERYRLITTLPDPGQAPATHLAACYAQRWEIETSYREIKTITLGPGRMLRSAGPPGITQEIWALLCTCQLTHAARAHAAATGGHDPDRISYTITLRAIRRAITTTSADITAEAPARPLRARRRRSYPRLIGASTTKRRTARAGPTATITYKITITLPP